MSVTERIDVFLQYYKPHVSGLTNMAADLAGAAVRSGYEVHVHCVAKEGGTTHQEMDGVQVHAYRRTFSLGRGNFSISLLLASMKLRRLRGIAHFHLPLPESAFFSWVLGPGWRTIVTYQCDAPVGSTLDTLIARALDASHRVLIRRANVTCTSSSDYADESRLRDLFRERGAIAIPATSIDRRGGTRRFALEGRRQLGFLGRPTAEKGIDVLMDALEQLPDDLVLTLAGPLDGLADQVGYDRQRLQRLIDNGRARSLGFLAEEDIADFYASLDVFALPSTNSFEAFGIVQVEAMSAGTPVVASALPGVRTIVRSTGFGEIAEIADGTDLARAVMLALDTEYDVARARDVLEERYLSPVPENAYLGIYRRLAA
ncbi:glycosyltransferase family 4 protein [Agromyces aureus]|uniref:D-inositol 3-phosphate glycosyltransferase n=1 Tax=Agromyces aureus TaxID=453304 RepID=A0A191WHB6_9MICO|nr:glycosyltransferase family 4 protein [Agromyces aureus]ANJ27690.1 hypothetical protein ATC03_14205 [Agromyces aureus]